MLDYGIIGNCKACALIDKKGSVDWFCFPHFASPSVFAKILDEDKGGSLSIEARGNYKISQQYQEHTNILETTYDNGRDKFVIIDFFPRYRKLLENNHEQLFRQNNLVRLIKPLKGKPIIKVIYDPKLNYAQGDNRHRVFKGNLITRNKHHKLCLNSNVDYDLILQQLHFKLDHTKYFMIGEVHDHGYVNATYLKRLENATRTYWRRWVRSMTLPEQHRERIIRSALILKLLTYSETGAIVAAPTTSLPEELGEERNWDYRYCWVRDAAFTVDAFKKIGRDHEAKKLLNFFLENSSKKHKPLQLMYGIYGEAKLTEKTLDHLSGHRGSRPVRVGNAAYDQKQHDIYGSLIDLLYLYYAYYEYEKRLPKQYWNFLVYLVKEIEKRWRRKDQGIWEFRGIKQHFTYSKLMCYVGVDRAVKLAQHYKKHEQAEQWAQLRDRIQADILRKAWHERKRAFTMYYGGEELDAAVLMMSYHEFLQPDDPRLINTVKAINDELRTAGLVQRYKIRDDFGVSGSAFTICSFWLIDALYNIGEQGAARKLYDQLAKYSNHLDLYSEDLDLKTKHPLGNFPQAYTHIALINSSILLSEWNTKRKKLPKSPYRIG
ncbi:glycoside hydrolase family 15 protein [Candidatus Woesearchaeota archaeon]|nr:glycoside hydrolase family 15 protein [Candidatus Woesearchaeota archaeon]